MTDATLQGTSHNANKQLIDTLLSSRLFRSYENVFTTATGLALTLRPLEYWQLEHRQKAQENRFCALLSQRPATLAVCLHSHAKIIRRTRTTPCTQTCPFGLTETAVPVRFGGETIGFLRIGQVLRRSATRVDKVRVAAKLRKCRVPFTNSIRNAWEATPIIPKDKYNAIVRLLTFFAEELSTSINQIVLEKQNSEPPLVRKAREYAKQHKLERIPLSTVARAASANVSYFCRIFKKTTGLTFTDYVGRLRVEDAKAQLLNPNRRISEIAYDVGFQSLTQFNRLFKRVHGQSPTEFRAHLGRKRRRA